MEKVRNVQKVQRAVLAFACSATLLIGLAPSAQATWLTYLTSPAHQSVKTNISINYEVQQIHFGITETDPHRYYFYLNFVKQITSKLFSDGLNSYSGIDLDLNGDNQMDYSIRTDPALPYESNLIHAGIFYELASGKSVLSQKCEVQTFSDILKQVDWIGFSIPKDCLPFGTSFSVQGFSQHDPKGKKEFDLVPETPWNVLLNADGTSSAISSTVSTSASSTPVVGSNSELPSVTSEFSPSIVSPAKSPDDLVALAAVETQSVVTVNCGTGLGSGWSAKVQLTNKMIAAGYKSYVITNQHVIKECIESRNVTLTLANQNTIQGYLQTWDETNDMAGILTKQSIPQLSLSGVRPQEGWWAGVIGSPLGFPGVLTEGIISSVSATSALATTTAHINPGNSGGPAFDRTGRVVGLATAKYVDSEGFGIIHGTPSLCLNILNCINPENLWAQGTTTSTATSSSSTEVDLLDKSLALRNASQMLLEGAKGLLERTIAQLKLAAANYPAAKKDLLKFESLAPQPPTTTDSVVSDVNAIAGFASEVTSFGKLVNARVDGLSVTTKVVKEKTITCIKATTTKKVTGVNPKCPSGFKIKA